MLTPEELEQDRIKTLKVLENSYLMYEESKKKLIEDGMKLLDNNGNPVHSEQSLKKNMELIETAEKDVIDKYIQLGGTEEALKTLKKNNKKGGANKKALEEFMKNQTAKEEMAEYIKSMRERDVQPTEVVQQQTVVTENPVKEEVKPVITKPVIDDNTDFNVSGTKMYDFVELPSGGECYRHKKKKLKVSYLTAYDENMILSPNLYKDGNFIDYLLKSKVIEDGIDVQELTEGDRDAILIWLRATGYGNEYPIVVTDDETGKEFETTIDLSALNYKQFKLKGDENGYFTFTMPKTNDIIKFKFLTVKDLNLLKKLKIEESKKLSVANIREICSNLMDATRDTDLISSVAKTKIKGAVETIREEINNNYNEETDLSFSHELTDRLLLQTVSVNGITDRKYVDNYIFSMNVKDAAAYRKFIMDNEPGVDFNVEVQRPESLGGGSIKSFLQLDQFIFINV